MAERFDNLIQQLRAELAAPLPGPDAQYQMAPRPRRGGEQQDKPPKDVRKGGVLILLFAQKDEPHLPLILRPTYDGVHSGQVAFPGGGKEPEDKDIAATALREAYEEVGVHPDQVNILGRLSPLHVNASNYLVQPVVGWVAQKPAFKADPYEVEKLLTPSLAEIQDQRNCHTEVWQMSGQNVTVPFYKVQGEIIWGATAMILSELLSLRSLRANLGDHEVGTKLLCKGLE